MRLVGGWGAHIMTVGERINYARLHPKKGDGRKITLEQIAKAVGKSTNLIKKWENNESAPKARDLFIFSDLTGYSPAWIQRGVEDFIPNATLDVLGKVGRVVPRVELTEVGPYLAGDESVASGQAVAHRPYGERAFQTVIRDRSNWPKLEPGDGLIVDPDVNPEPEDLCIALVEGKYIVRQYAEKDDYVELIPLNDAFKKVRVSKDDIVGRVMEFSRQV